MAVGVCGGRGGGLAVGVGVMKSVTVVGLLLMFPSPEPVKTNLIK